MVNAGRRQCWDYNKENIIIVTLKQFLAQPFVNEAMKKRQLITLPGKQSRTK